MGGTRDTLDYLASRFDLDLTARSPIEIPNIGRDGLAELFGDLRFQKGVELGVEQGLYTEVLAKSNPNGIVIGVDAWTTYPGYRDHVSQDKLDGFYQDTLERLKPYPNASLLRAFSAEAADTFQDNSLDWVYIDANHEWAHVTFDICAWSKKVRPGGIVSGHDYRKNKRKDTRNHVVYIVNAFMQSFRIEPWFLLGRKMSESDEIRDHVRSWMYVK